MEVSAANDAPKGYGNAYLLSQARALLACGLHDAAAKVLKEVDLAAEPQLAEPVALLYDAAREHSSSFRLAYTLAGRGSPNPLPSVVSKLLFPVDYEAVIRQEAEVQKLDPLLVFSLIKQESAYKEAAESRAGALGLMQLMPDTAIDLARRSNEPPPAPQDLLKSETNVRLGVRYLKRMIDHYGGNAYYAAAAYNAGSDRVDRWVKQWGTLPIEEFVELIPFEETRNYVKSIVRNYAFYNLLREKRPVDVQSLTKVVAP
ncbi:MAG: lytic transglycosylase domain-containing protein [Pseudomonadota bacterium]